METKEKTTEEQIKERLVTFINYCLEQDSSNATYHSFYGFYVSHFNKVCAESDLPERLAEELMQASKDVKNEFMDEFDVYGTDGTVRVCDTCGKFMFEGYYLAGEYACSEDCAVKNYMQSSYSHSKDGKVDEETAKKLFQNDLQYDDDNCTGEVYWTEW